MSSMRKDVVVIEQIIELKNRGMGPRKISRCLKIARNTVRKAIRENEARLALTKETQVGAQVEVCDQVCWQQSINWAHLREENAKGATIKVLHQETCGGDVNYWQFWRAFRQHAPKTQGVTIRLNHQPAEKTFFDFADGIDIVDRKTGEVTTTQFLCGVLPFSSYTYGEFVPSQKQAVLMSTIERAWHYFGGVTPYVTVDNLKAGVTRAHIYDPVVNPGFVEFANHCGFAVLPARPYKPRDKASNESGIGVIQRSFFAEVRNQIFYSIAELNQTFWTYLKKLNHQTMKDHGISRAARFETEKPLLKAIPTNAYELCEWKECKVHADCHVQIENRFYSVPFAYVGRVVKARLTTRLVEIFNEDREPLAVHMRLNGKVRVSTQEDHYPEKKLSLTKFEVRHAKNEATRIGPKTKAVIDELLDQEYPLRYLRRVQGILRLVQSGQVSRESLEYACMQGLTFRKLHYDYIKSTAKFYQINGNRPVAVAPLREPTEVHLHNR